MSRIAPRAALLLTLATLVAPVAADSATSVPVPHAKSYGIWAPGRSDTCTAALHDRYATRGPGGKLYPSWHPPSVVDPATGRRCSFGHEHGRNPRRSDLYRWVAHHLGGLPFGAATEALDAYAAANPGVATRHEDHVGHKVEWQDDVRRGGVTCDFLTKVHQGSHSADAFANNVHELIYAMRCDDGTRLLTTTLARFARPNRFARSCQPSFEVVTSSLLRFPPGRGIRQIPDRACVDRHVLVPTGHYSRFARGLYEHWASSNRLFTRSGRQIAYWDPAFAVFNPSRYFDPTRPNGLARTVDLCWERPTSGDRASGSACDLATDYGRRAPIPFDDPRSPFDGTHRETYLNQTSIFNRRGPRRWYTNPYGRNASRRPFTGALCQLVSPTLKRRRVESQAFGAERPYSRRAVHAPN